MPPLGQAIWLLGSCLKGSFVLVPARKVNLKERGCLDGEKEAMIGGKPSTDSKKGHFGLQQSKSHPNTSSGSLTEALEDISKRMKWSD